MLELNYRCDGIWFQAIYQAIFFLVLCTFFRNFLFIFLFSLSTACLMLMKGIFLEAMQPGDKNCVFFRLLHTKLTFIEKLDALNRMGLTIDVARVKHSERLGQSVEILIPQINEPTQNQFTFASPHHRL